MMLNRRRFISISLLTGAYASLPSAASTGSIVLGTSAVSDESRGYIMTVTGKIKPSTTGIFLPHEHTFTDFIGAEKVIQPQYNRKAAFDFILPYLKKLKASGVKTLAECTPAYIGRDAILLKQLSRASGLNIITNTGYYAAVDFKYLPAHAYTETSEQLAARWLKEWHYGIGDSGIRPGFIKLGVGNAPLKPLEKKLISAAAITHRHSGLKIAIHTGNGEAAAEEAGLLKGAGLKPDAMIWVHAQNDDSGKYHIELARLGCWISLDGFNGSDISIAKYLRHLQALKSTGLLHKVLISHDEGFSVAEGGLRFDLFNKENSEPYTSVLTILRPALLNAGFTTAEVNQIMIRNPSDAFRIELQALN